jgi:hypothetical protein
MDRHEVGQANYPVGAEKGGLENVGPIAIPATICVRGDRGDAQIPTPTTVEQPAEGGGCIKSSRTVPVDRSLLRDEGGCLAVADKGIIRDRTIG